MKNKFVIFHANHSAALYQFIVLKNKYFSNDDVILMVNNINLGDSDFAKGLVKNNVFTKVIPFCEPFSDYQGLTGKAAIFGFYDKLLAENEISIENTSAIITACDIQNWFGLYCVFKNIYPDFLEMHDKQFLNHYRYEGNRTTSNGPLWVEELSKQYHILDGEDENCKRRYLCLGSDVKFDGKDIKIDFINEFYNLPIKLRRKIVKAMHLGSSDYSKCNLLLLNSFGWTTARTKDPYPLHYLPYLLLSDYYFEDSQNTILFKDHPQTNSEYFKNTLSKKESVISSVIPIEFLGLIENFSIQKLLSVNSTGNEKISKFVKREVKIGDSYLYNWKIVHKLFVTMILESIFEKSINFHVFGIDHCFVENFIANSNTNFRYEKILGVDPSILKWNIFTVIGNIEDNDVSKVKHALINADEQTKVVFFGDNVINSFDENDVEIMKHIVPVTITKAKLPDGTLDDLTPETLYFFCKDDVIKQKVKQFTLIRELKHSGIEINAHYDYALKNEIEQNLKIQSLIVKIANLEKEIYELKKPT